MAANFCCSIEMEPKTLNEGQLNHAREVAVDIVQNNKPNEASSIFVEGFKPVIGFEEMAQTIQNGDSVYKIVDQRKDSNTTNINESCCQCSLASSIIESPDEIKLKEPVSAPF